MVYDLPASGKRLVQRARGYVATVKSGVVVREQDEPTGERPGRLFARAAGGTGVLAIAGVQVWTRRHVSSGDADACGCEVVGFGSALCLSRSPLIALHDAGRRSGPMVNSGHGSDRRTGRTKDDLGCGPSDHRCRSHRYRRAQRAFNRGHHPGGGASDGAHLPLHLERVRRARERAAVAPSVAAGLFGRPRRGARGHLRVSSRMAVGAHRSR